MSFLSIETYRKSKTLLLYCPCRHPNMTLKQLGPSVAGVSAQAQTPAAQAALRRVSRCPAGGFA